MKQDFNLRGDNITHAKRFKHSYPFTYLTKFNIFNLKNNY